MQKLSLIGFTEQNANIIAMFIKTNFSTLQLAKVSRSIVNNQFVFPKLTAAIKSHDMFIIDVEGVGLSAQQPASVYQQLNQLFAYQPILLIGRQGKADRQDRHQAESDDEVRYHWLTVPYTRQQMLENIQQLIDYTRRQQAKAEKLTIVLASPEPTASTLSELAPSKLALSKPAAITPPVTSNAVLNSDSTTQKTDLALIETLFAIIAETFPAIATNVFFDFAKQLQLINELSCVQVRNHHLYVNPLTQSVVASRLERVIDHFVIGQNHTSNLFEIKAMDEAQFHQQTARYLSQGDKHFMMSQVIWFMGLELIQRNQYDVPHNLAIEAKYMPNLSGSSFVPSYVIPMIASCLGRPRRLIELSLLFPTVSIAQVNQVILLMIMSNIINTDTLIQSYKRPIAANPTSVTPSIAAQSSLTNQSPITANAGVKKASESGFLKRFLGKLGVKLS